MSDRDKRDLPLWARVGAGFLALAITVSWPALLGVAGWAHAKLSDHELRINVLEEVREAREKADAKRDEALGRGLAALREELVGARKKTGEVLQRLTRVETLLERGRK